MANDFDLTRLVPRVLPLALRFGWAVAYGFGTVSQLNMGYRSSPAVQEGRPVVRRGPKVGDRLPDTHTSPKMGRCPGWVRRWPGPASTCCSAGRSAAGMSANSPSCARATPACWPCTSSPARPRPAPCTTSTGRPSPAGCHRRLAVPGPTRRPHRLPQWRHRPGRPPELPHPLAPPTPRHGQPDQVHAPRRSHQSMAPPSAGDFTPLPALAITDDASRSALRSTRNRRRTAMHLGAALPGGGGASRGCSPLCQAVAQGGRSTGPRAGRPPGTVDAEGSATLLGGSPAGRRGGGW